MFINQSVESYRRDQKSQWLWIFYKDPATINIKNSFAKPGDEYIIFYSTEASRLYE